jgi:hypothetical protein
VEVRALTPEDAADIAAWRYPGREATYDVVEVVTARDGFWAVEHEGDLVGYCCSRRVAEALSFRVDSTVTNEQGVFQVLVRLAAGEGSG